MADIRLKDSQGTIHDYSGINKVTVPTQTGTSVTFSADGGIVPTGNIDLTSVGTTNVTNYATATILDANLVPSNIKKDVHILGVVGNLEGSAKTEETFNVFPKNASQHITPTSGNVFSDGYVRAIWTDVVTPEAMNTKLVADNVGRMYRYVGDSTTEYKTNWLYIVSEVAEEPTVTENTLSGTYAYSASQDNETLELI